MESMSQTFMNPIDFGKTATSLISRSGDLMYNIYLQTTLPDIPADPSNYNYRTWTDDIGHHLIKWVSIDIGGQIVDRHYGDWLEIWAQLTVPAGKVKGYREMIGQDPRGPLGLNSGLQRDTTDTILGKTVYVPLQFWFCRNIGLALPLIALQHHEVRITIELRPLKELINSFDVSELGPTVPINLPPMGSLTQTNLWVDYIFLDIEERRRFAQVPHEYLIEQLQYKEEDIEGSINTDRVELELSLNHTVKEIIWVVQYKAGITEGHVQWSNYTDRSSINFSTHGRNILDLNNLGSIIYDTEVTSNRASSNNLQAATNPSHCRPPGSQNPVTSACIQLNGNDRFSEQVGKYFNSIQTLKHHTCIPESPGINVYSFALKPELHQPSGTCNFSRINKAKLVMSIKSGTNYPSNDSFNNVTANFLNSPRKVKIFAVNYNILRIMSGMGAVAYS
jgi:hypothetical protein